MENSLIRPWYERFAWIGTIIIGLGILALITAAASGVGYANEVWDLQLAFLLLRYAVFVCMGMIVLSLFSAFLAHKNQRKPRLVMSVILFLVCGGVAANVLMQVKTARSLPFIHDVTTDLENIPVFQTLSPDNPNNDNWAEEHQKGYADIKPLVLAMDVESVIRKAADISKGFGWEIAAENAGEGRLEVTETTLWFQFKDDLVLRVKSDGNGGSIVDARSVSRVGGSDIGVNAARIRKLFTALSK